MEKKLTASEKIEVLERVIVYLQRGEVFYICHGIELVMAGIEERAYITGNDSMHRYIPELLKYKPENLCNNVWFRSGDIGSRIHVIRETIKDIESSIKASSD